MDTMKTSLGWNEEATICNATMALFNILRVINNWAILNQDGHQNTWTYLKKAMIRH